MEPRLTSFDIDPSRFIFESSATPVESRSKLDIRGLVGGIFIDKSQFGKTSTGLILI